MDLSAQDSLIGCGNCSSETLAADKKMMTHKELIAKMRSQPGYKEKYDEAEPEFELLRKILYKLGRLSSPSPRYANISS